MSKRPKTNKDTEKIEIRCSVNKKLHRKIRVYQHSHDLNSMEIAVNTLLEKATDGVVLAD